MRRLYGALSLLLLSVLFVQCQREVSHIGGPDFPGQVAAPDPITAALQGNVFDESGAPAAGVTVQAGSKTTLTNANGYFRINDASLDKGSALVSAAKAGYFKAYRTFAATSGANNVEIKLVKKVLTGTINAGTGGDVSLSNGSKVALPASGVVNAATSAAYTGTVNVYAAYIDPSAADIAQSIPGSFMADDKDGKRVVLSSYGMLAVELEGASGEKLQIKAGTTATLTTAIPASTQASAPATIALWSVDELTGIWKEEGKDTKIGNVYVGQVNHFSFWNCDVSANAVRLSMTIKNSDGAPLVRAHVTLKRANTNWVVHGWTDSLGQVSGYVPYNETLQMNVLDQCNLSFYTQNVGPFTQHTTLGAITLNNTGSAVVTVKGKLVNCGSAPVTNGFAIVKFGNYSHYANVNATGDFQTTFTSCASSPAAFEILGVDNAAQQQSNSATPVGVTMPITTTGNISACGSSTTQFINYTLDGTPYSLVKPADSLRGNLFGQGATLWYSNLSGESLSSSNQISFAFTSTGTIAGTYPLSFISVNQYDSTRTTSPINVNVTNFPTSPGQFYEGNFSGQFRDQSNANHTVSATFRVRYQ
ncbi:MAG TPA: carboxypeptidase-like regulatory domain-containing protein [Flavisolibacter sp.]|nr:carboxypeptidase-like regulatory domain-containing protein [Flavisolibacter sp.]